MNQIKTFLRVLGIGAYLSSGPIESKLRTDNIEVLLQSNDVFTGGGGGGGGTHGASILMETSGYILMETSDTILLE